MVNPWRAWLPGGADGDPTRSRDIDTSEPVDTTAAASAVAPPIREAQSGARAEHWLDGATLPPLSRGRNGPEHGPAGGLRTGGGMWHSAPALAGPARSPSCGDLGRSVNPAP